MGRSLSPRRSTSYGKVIVMTIVACLLCLSPLVATLARAQDLTPAQFEDGDVVCFIGDSITHSRKYHSYVYDYYLTRFPERRIRFVNCGIAGDSAGGAVWRFDWDILPTDPDVVCIMFGMNDVSRGLYGKTHPDEANLAARRVALDRHRENQLALAQKLKAAFDPRFVFITPSPYDDTAQIDMENLFGVNAALATCGEYARELAAEIDGGVADFNGPMTALNLEHQKQDPSFTIVGPDRVHPGDVGMLVMAYLFLKAQQVPAVVSHLALDGETGRVEACENAQVSNVAVRPEGLEFDYLQNALPFPVEPGAAGALELVPFTAELNRETFAVRLKREGTCRLLIDGEEVGRYTSGELGAGVNLAANAHTPQYRQAQALHAVNERRRGLEVRLRSHAQVKMMLLRAEVEEADKAAVRAYFDDFLAKNSSNAGYFRSQFDNYLRTGPERQQIEAQLEELLQQLWRQNRPVSHHYQIVRVDR